MRFRGKDLHLALRGDSQDRVRFLQAEPRDMIPEIIEAFVFHRGRRQHEQLVLQTGLRLVLPGPHANHVVRQGNRLVVSVSRGMRDAVFHSCSSRMPLISCDMTACEKYNWAMASESWPICSRMLERRA